MLLVNQSHQGFNKEHTSKMVSAIVLYVLLAAAAHSAFAAHHHHHHHHHHENLYFQGSDKIIHLTDDSFDTDVLKADGAILVDFWAEWSGPSKMIAPILDEIADEYQGKLTVAKLNIDQNPGTAPKYGIRGIPTLLLFANGEVAATKVGALSKGQLKEFLDANLAEAAAKAVYITVELAIAVLAILGNVLVCWAVWLNSNLQNVTNYFVVSLAAADIAVGVLAIPFAITISTGFCAACHGCLFIACFVLVLTQSSIFSLLAIAIDRYIAIRIPLRYNGLVTGTRAKGIIAICWVLSFAIGLTPMLGWNNCGQPKEGKAHSQGCGEGQVACLFEDVVPMNYMVYFNFFACVLVPLLLMLGVYLRIFLAARRQLKQMESQPLPGERARSTLQKEVHAAKSLAIIVGLFALCWLPLHIINCFTFFCPDCSHAPLWLMYLAIVLSHTNSVVNPFIYAYRIREFRQTFRKIIRSHVLRQQEPFKA
uniref:TrxA,Adenosine receptor A2a n=1 Tax=Homo sapiens TaxID=9606 RepID=UPI000D5FE0B7|nr:Chain A, TrxA,Adenosine receptor A2a [Escherichia coli]